VPRTLEVLNAIDTLKITGMPREVVFSMLQPGQLIPPHYGVANTDATVHLPLLIAAAREDEGSEKCGIRVTDTTHLWRRGQAFAFDDSFEHESWNRSASVRVNLLFEAWHPDLSQPERNAVQAAFAARDAWNRQRRI